MNVLQASPSPPKLKKTIADDVNQIIYYGRSCVTAQHLDFFSISSVPAWYVVFECNLSL